MSLWLFRHQIFVPVLNVSDVPPCGIVGFSEVEILVRFNTLWPSKGYGDRPVTEAAAELMTKPAETLGTCTLPAVIDNPKLRKKVWCETDKKDIPVGK